jgi:hypothetical protein
MSINLEEVLEQENKKKSLSILKDIKDFLIIF